MFIPTCFSSPLIYEGRKRLIIRIYYISLLVLALGLLIRDPNYRLGKCLIDEKSIARDHHNFSSLRKGVCFCQQYAAIFFQYDFNQIIYCIG